MILRPSTTPNPNTPQQVRYKSSSKVHQTAAVTPSSDGSRPSASYFHPMNPMSTKGNVVANIRNGRRSSTNPGLPPCRDSPGDDHNRTRLETRQNQRCKSLEKDLDVTRDHMVHGKSTKRKNMAYQNDSNNDSFLQNNAQTSRYLKECSVYTASGCHLQRRSSQTLQHSSSDLDDDGELQLLPNRPQSRSKQNQAGIKSTKEKKPLGKKTKQ